MKCGTPAQAALRKTSVAQGGAGLLAWGVRTLLSGDGAAGSCLDTFLPTCQCLGHFLGKDIKVISSQCHSVEISWLQGLWGEKGLCRAVVSGGLGWRGLGGQHSPFSPFSVQGRLEAGVPARLPDTHRWVELSAAPAGKTGQRARRVGGLWPTTWGTPGEAGRPGPVSLGVLCQLCSRLHVWRGCELGCQNSAGSRHTRFI